MMYKHGNSNPQPKLRSKGKHRNNNSNNNNTKSREIQISKSLSLILRHRAVEEKIPIDEQGYIRLDHILQWRKFRNFSPGQEVTFDEIVDVVVNNEKKRFGLRYISPSTTTSSSNTTTDISDENEERGGTEEAIKIFKENIDQNPMHFFIRANQGHSIASVLEDGVMVPIISPYISDGSVKWTVVHGTFYSFWNKILRDGGLKKMTRNHVHFASGPTLDSILPDTTTTTNTTTTITTTTEDKPVMGDKVISGMRGDAQILIYIDLVKALEKMTFWRSENGVILSSGIGESGLIPIDVWDVVVEIKAGLGVLWKSDVGVVKELPDDLAKKGVPLGKGRRKVHDVQRQEKKGDEINAENG